MFSFHSVIVENFSISKFCAHTHIYLFIICLLVHFSGRQFIFALYHKRHQNKITPNQNDRKQQQQQEKTIAQIEKPRREQTWRALLPFQFLAFVFFLLHCLNGPVAEKFHGSLELSYISNKNRKFRERNKKTTDFCKLSMEWSFILINLSLARFWRCGNFFLQKIWKNF